MLKKLSILVVLVLVGVPAFAQNLDSIPFTPAVNYGARAYPNSVFCADLDGDGDMDLAVASEYYVSILKNNGDGTFQTAVNYAIGVAQFQFSVRT